MGKNARLTKALRVNPQAQRHARVIKETFKALDSLRKSGFSTTGHELGSPYGGNRSLKDVPETRSFAISKMTYGA